MRRVLILPLLIGLSGCGEVLCEPMKERVLSASDDGSTVTFLTCRQEGAGLGLRTADGETLIGTEYQALHVMSSAFAYGQRQGRATWDMIDLPSGAVRETSFTDMDRLEGRDWDHLWDDAIYGMTAPRDDGRRDVSFFDVHGKAVNVVNDVGGTSVRRDRHNGGQPVLLELVGRVIVLHATADNGAALSRIYDLLGNPLTPVLPRIEPSWINDTLRVTEYGAVFARQWGPPDERRMLPLQEDGTLVPLPPGCAGMVPLTVFAQEYTTGDPPETEGWHSGWALVFPREDGGFDYAVGLGTASRVVANLSTLTWVADLRLVARAPDEKKDRAHFARMAWRRAGSDAWELINMVDLLPDPVRTYASFEAAKADYSVVQGELQRAYEEKRARELAELQARLRAEAPAKFERCLAAGDKLGAREQLLILEPDPERWTLFVTRLGIGNDDEGDFALLHGASEAAVAKARYELQKLRDEHETWLNARDTEPMNDWENFWLGKPIGPIGGAGSYDTASIYQMAEHVHEVERQNQREWLRGAQSWGAAR